VKKKLRERLRRYQDGDCAVLDAADWFKEDVDGKSITSPVLDEEFPGLRVNHTC
jgi:hypothetical protein